MRGVYRFSRKDESSSPSLIRGKQKSFESKCTHFNIVIPYTSETSKYVIKAASASNDEI
jgi:hypothetical protein